MLVVNLLNDHNSMDFILVLKVFQPLFLRVDDKDHLISFFDDLEVVQYILIVINPKLLQYNFFVVLHVPINILLIVSYFIAFKQRLYLFHDNVSNLKGVWRVVYYEGSTDDAVS